jgi:hypothetical protein
VRNLEIKVLQDRDLVNQYDESVIDSIRKLGITRTVNKERIYFCGVIIATKCAYVVLPRNSLEHKELSDINEWEFASVILKALDRYGKNSSTSLSTPESEEDSIEGANVLSYVLWLLHDYASHGLYTTSQKTRSLDRGKINWSRTINKEIPSRGMGSAPVYLRFRSDRLSHREQNLITYMHAEAIKELDFNFSWLITGDPDISIANDIAQTPKSPLDLESKIRLLRSELNYLYGDREISLVKHLIAFYEDRGRSFSGEFVIGVKTFEHMWEDMLRQTFPSVLQLNSSLPKPAVFMEGTPSPYLMRGMMTDIISGHAETFAILDAKYYEASSPETSPGWSDLVKQYFYAKALKAIFPKKDITNWFVFPGKSNCFQAGPIAKISVMNTADRNLLEVEFPSIGCAYAPPLEVLEKYVSFKKYDYEDVSIIYKKA